MMFYLIRILFVAVIVFLFIVISKKKKWKFNKLKICISIIFFVTLYVIIALFPIESSFLRFKTIEHAFNYSSGGMTIQNIIEEKDCAFIISSKSENSTSFHTITKFDDKWGMIDVALNNSPFVLNKESDIEKKAIYSASCVTNRETEKTLVIIRLLTDNLSLKDLKIANCQGEEFVPLKQQEIGGVYSREFYKIEEGPLPSDFEVCVHNGEITSKLNFIKAY